LVVESSQVQNLLRTSQESLCIIIAPAAILDQSTSGDPGYPGVTMDGVPIDG